MPRRTGSGWGVDGQEDAEYDDIIKNGPSFHPGGVLEYRQRERAVPRKVCPPVVDPTAGPVVIAGPPRPLLRTVRLRFGYFRIKISDLRRLTPKLWDCKL
jgi:hypothetical protein